MPVRPSVPLNDRTYEHDVILSTLVRSYFVAKTLVSLRPLLNDLRNMRWNGENIIVGPHCTEDALHYICGVSQKGFS